MRSRDVWAKIAEPAQVSRSSSRGLLRRSATARGRAVLEAFRQRRWAHACETDRRRETAAATASSLRTVDRWRRSRARTSCGSRSREAIPRLAALARANVPGVTFLRETAGQGRRPPAHRDDARHDRGRGRRRLSRRRLPVAVPRADCRLRPDPLQAAHAARCAPATRLRAFGRPSCPTSGWSAISAMPNFPRRKRCARPARRAAAHLDTAST